MYGYIYKTTNLINGKIYIGQHKNDHFNPEYFGSGVRFLNVFNKYGKENFKCELLEECFSEEELNCREKYWIEKLNSMDRDIGYNLMSGGYRSRGFKFSDEVKDKISKNRKGVIPNRIYTSLSEDLKSQISNTLKEYYKSHDNPRKGKHLSENTKQKLREANLGKKQSKETIQKRKDTMLNNNGVIVWNKGKHLSEETKQKLREANLGKRGRECEESLKIKREKWLGKNNPNYGGLSESTKKKLRDYNLGRIWVTNGELSKQILPDELQNYIDKGYVRGRKLKS